MRNLIVTLIGVFALFGSNNIWSQEVLDSISNQDVCYSTPVDSLILEISEMVAVNANREYVMALERGRYKMYTTENIYNLLKLDTATGRIEQVQWSLDNDEEMIVTINPSRLSFSEKIGTFELYPTKNIYQFILLDTTDGRVWHVQWGTKPKQRWIHRIY